MILKTAHVKNFKCVRDSNPFRIDEKVTCLVGKNEAGKTALLQALYKLNPLRPADAKFQDMEYPRWDWSKYKERAATSPADAIVTVWTLEDDDVAAINAVLGPKSLTSKDVEIKKGYYEKTIYTIKVDESAVISHLLTKFPLHPDVRDRLRKHKTVKELHADLAAQTQRQDAEEKLLSCVTGFRELSPRQAAIDVLHPRLPKFVYIPEYFRLPGQVSIDDLKKRTATPPAPSREGARGVHVAARLDRRDGPRP
jgi:AAA15 family ATPase/GTPase